MDKDEIEKMYMDVLGHVTCEHGVYLPDNHCTPCGEGEQAPSEQNAPGAEQEPSPREQKAPVVNKRE